MWYRYWIYPKPEFFFLTRPLHLQEGMKTIASSKIIRHHLAPLNVIGHFPPTTSAEATRCKQMLDVPVDVDHCRGSVVVSKAFMKWLWLNIGV